MRFFMGLGGNCGLGGLLRAGLRVRFRFGLLMVLFRWRELLLGLLWVWCGDFLLRTSILN
jgi:hypothetical protein